MTGALFHLAVCSAGLLAAGCILRMAAARGRSDPTAIYRFGVVTLVVTLGLLASQTALAGMWDRPKAAVFVERYEDRCFESRAGGSAVWEFDRAVTPAPVPWATVLDWAESTALQVLYGTGAAVIGLYHGYRLLLTTRFLRGCRPVDDAAVLDSWRRVAAGSRLRDRVRLLTHPQLKVPCCWALCRPHLVVPETECSSEELDWGLRHELIHLERGDSRVAVMQAMLTALFWFHPVAWWLSRQLDEWRELSCDRRVVAKTGGCRRYALALLEFAARVQPGVDRPPAWRASMLHGSDSCLRRRIEMLAVNASPVAGWKFKALAPLLVLVWVGQLALAASPPRVVLPDRPSNDVLEMELILRKPDKQYR